MPLDREQIARDARIVFSSAEGERVLGYLLQFTHVFTDSVGDQHGIHFDTNRTLFNEGQRSVGNELVALLVNEPDRFKVQNLRKTAALSEGNDI